MTAPLSPTARAENALNYYRAALLDIGWRTWNRYVESRGMRVAVYGFGASDPEGNEYAVEGRVEDGRPFEQASITLVRPAIERRAA